MTAEGRRRRYAGRQARGTAQTAWQQRSHKPNRLGTGMQAAANTAPEVPSHIQALVVAIQHVDSAALLPRLTVQLPQQQHRACTHRQAQAHGEVAGTCLDSAMTAFKTPSYPYNPTRNECMLCRGAAAVQLRTYLTVSTV